MVVQTGKTGTNVLYLPQFNNVFQFPMFYVIFYTCFCAKFSNREFRLRKQICFRKSWPAYTKVFNFCTFVCSFVRQFVCLSVSTCRSLLLHNHNTLYTQHFFFFLQMLVIDSFQKIGKYLEYFTFLTHCNVMINNFGKFIQ